MNIAMLNEEMDKRAGRIDEGLLKNIIQKGQNALIKKYGGKQQAIAAGKKYLAKNKKIVDMLKKKYGSKTTPLPMPESMTNIERMVLEEGIMDFFVNNKRKVFTAILFMTLMGLVPGTAFANDSNDQIAKELSQQTNIEQQLDTDVDPLQDALDFLNSTGDTVEDLGNGRYGLTQLDMVSVIKVVGADNIVDDNGVFAKLSPGNCNALGIDNPENNTKFVRISEIPGAKIYASRGGASISVGNKSVMPDNFVVSQNILTNYGEQLLNNMGSSSVANNSDAPQENISTFAADWSQIAANTVINKTAEKIGVEPETIVQKLAGDNGRLDPQKTMNWFQVADLMNLYNQIKDAI